MSPQDRSPELRVSDADRERVVSALRAHAGAGRLDADELEDRVGAALAARTQGELAPLLADLPAGRAPARHGSGRRRAAAVRQEWAKFAAVQLVLVAVWALTGFGYFWVVWPMVGWGIPLLLRSRMGACGRSRRLPSAELR